MTSILGISAFYHDSAACILKDGKIISPLIMAGIFFLVVTPIGLIMRLLKKDLLNLKFNKNRSYWIEKEGPKSKMKNQF